MKLKTKKYYKKLYLDELENRGKLIKHCSEINAENVEYQEEIKKLREHCARLTMDLEDLDGFLKQETEAKEYLLKERKKLRTMVTKLGGDWKNGK